MKKLYEHSNGETYFAYSLVTKLTKEYKCNGNQVMLYMAICDVLLQDPDNKAISIERLRGLTGFNKSTIPQIANILAEKGLIDKWIPDGLVGQVTHYNVNWLEYESGEAK